MTEFKAPQVKLTVTESACRCGYHKKGDEFTVGDICPPLCQELWNNIYPYVFALRNGALLDCGETRAARFEARCPDGGRVTVRGELAGEPGCAAQAVLTTEGGKEYTQ